MATERASANPSTDQSRSGASTPRSANPAAIGIRRWSQTESATPARPDTIGQHDALGQQLTDNASAGGPERRPHGQFGAPRGPAGEQQTGHVGARDEQDQPDRSGQQNQPRRLTLEKGRLERIEAQRLALVGRGIQLLQALRDDVDLALRASDRDAGLQACDEHPVVELARDGSVVLAFADDAPQIQRRREPVVAGMTPTIVDTMSCGAAPTRTRERPMAARASPKRRLAIRSLI